MISSFFRYTLHSAILLLLHRIDLRSHCRGRLLEPLAQLKRFRSLLELVGGPALALGRGDLFLEALDGFGDAGVQGGEDAAGFLHGLALCGWGG